jgi:hypothetical protein
VPEGHLRADVLAHCDQSQSEHGHRLLRRQVCRTREEGSI